MSAGVDRHTTGRKQRKAWDLGGLNRVANLYLIADHRGKTWLDSLPKQFVNLWAAQVTIDQKHFLSRLGQRDGQIGRQGGLAVPHHRARDLNHLVLRTTLVEQQRRPDATVSLRFHRERLMVRADNRVERLRLGSFSNLLSAVAGKQGNLAHDGSLQKLVDLSRTAKRVVGRFRDAKPPATENQAQKRRNHHHLEKVWGRLLSVESRCEDRGAVPTGIFAQINPVQLLRQPLIKQL